MTRRWRPASIPGTVFAAVALSAALAATPWAAQPVAAQTLITVLKPGSPEIAQVLCDRLAAFGIAGARVYALESHRVRVEIDAAAYADLDLQATAELMVIPGAFSIRLVADGPGEGAEEIAWMDASNPPLFVDPLPIVTGADIAQVDATTDSFGEPVLVFRLDAAGARRFAEATSAHLGDALAIVIDGRVLSAPIVQQPILGGSGMISGLETPRQVAQLAAVLEGGPLPAAMELLISEFVSVDHEGIPVCTSEG
ncbi:MAG: hypothetical protein H6843_07810 [Rhodospirillaceae bacterium]|nr:hypothetical protein [Rhodospirillaceae bacterium]